MSDQQFLCSSCLINFQNEITYKLHYKTDFHRYNIARKMMNLNPVAEDVFQEKFVKLNIQPAPPQNNIIHHCCNKQFKSTNTYEQHLKSKSHKQHQIDVNLNKKANQIEQKPQKSNEIAPNICLFCDIVFGDNQSCLSHMNQEHGFFIREEKYIIDLPGLLKALAEQINKNQTCLHCFQTFKNPQAVKDHMITKSHCFMPEQEYKILSKYYNFEEKLTLLIASQQKMLEGSQQKQLLSEVQYVAEDNKQNIEQDDQWEDDDDDENDEFEDEDEDQVQQKSDTEIQKKQKLKQLLKQLHSKKAKLLKNGELLLPGGKVLGHRAYKSYYKQNHIPMQPFIEEQKLKMLEEGSQENQDQLAILNNDDFWTTTLKHIYQIKQNRNAHRQTLLGMQHNQIIRRWLRKSC